MKIPRPRSELSVMRTFIRCSHMCHAVTNQDVRKISVTLDVSSWLYHTPERPTSRTMVRPMPRPGSSLDKSDGQVARVSSNLLLQSDQLVYIPLRPHESSVEELCFRTGKPDSKIARQFLWKIT
jgi:hypothetical protein